MNKEYDTDSRQLGDCPDYFRLTTEQLQEVLPSLYIDGLRVFADNATKYKTYIQGVWNVGYDMGTELIHDTDSRCETSEELDVFLRTFRVV